MAIRYQQHKATNSPASYTTLSVQYRDGLVLTYLFERNSRVTDLMAAIRRAGLVQKVVLQ